jgi:hypothetical protein
LLEALQSDAVTVRLAAGLVPVLVLLALALAGCSSAPAAPPAADLQWAPMTVEAANPGPADRLGTYHLAWREGRFGVLAEGVPGLPVHGVVEGSILSTSEVGQAWVRWPLAEFQQAHTLAIRYTVWDLPRLLDSATDGTRAGDRFTASLDLDGRDGRETHVELRQEGGRIVWARVETSLDAAAPFTFTREDPQPFPMVPQPSLELAPVLDGDGRAAAGHKVLVAWIHEHRDLTGAFPKAISAEPGLDTLFLQSLQEEWPVNPFDGRPMADRGDPGHFQWQVCSPQDATFTGLGWDGTVVEESFGKGCDKGRGTQESRIPP